MSDLDPQVVELLAILNEERERRERWEAKLAAANPIEALGMDDEDMESVRKHVMGEGK